jgi:hypothetical protein
MRHQSMGWHSETANLALDHPQLLLAGNGSGGLDQLHGHQVDKILPLAIIMEVASHF